MAGRNDGASPIQRFREKVAPPDERGCTLWSGGRTRKDQRAYGLFYADGQMRPAHRWIFEHTHGKVLDPGIDACHRCDVRLCVNVDHIFAGSRKENMEDAVTKGRHSHGAGRPKAKLNDAAVREIRRRHTEGATQNDLVKAFGVTQTTISKIILRQSWKHVA